MVAEASPQSVDRELSELWNQAVDDYNARLGADAKKYEIRESGRTIEDVRTQVADVQTTFETDRYPGSR